MNLSSLSFFLVEEYKLAILNVPKTGGTSIKAAFLKQRGVSYGSTPHERQYFKYCTQEEISQLDDSWIKVATVRNPYDRFSSFYKNKIDMPNNFTNGQNCFRQGMPFEEVVDIVCNTPDEESDIHFASQTSQLYYKNKKLFGSLLRTETLDIDWWELQNFVNKDLPSLPHENRSHSKSFWTDKTRASIAIRFEDDFLNFGYLP